MQQNLRTRSNGETAMQYLTDVIVGNGLYLLDEPENVRMYAQFFQENADRVE